MTTIDDILNKLKDQNSQVHDEFNTLIPMLEECKKSNLLIEYSEEFVNHFKFELVTSPYKTILMAIMDGISLGYKLKESRLQEVELEKCLK